MCLVLLVDLKVVNNNDNQAVITFSEDLSAIARSSASQTVVEKLLPLEDLEPGEYTLKVKVTDNVRGETLIREGVFKVT